jgi:hypothetical protein
VQFSGKPGAGSTATGGSTTTAGGTTGTNTGARRLFTRRGFTRPFTFSFAIDSPSLKRKIQHRDRDAGMSFRETSEKVK